MMFFLIPVIVTCFIYYLGLIPATYLTASAVIIFLITGALYLLDVFMMWGLKQGFSDKAVEFYTKLKEDKELRSLRLDYGTVLGLYAIALCVLDPGVLYVLFMISSVFTCYKYLAYMSENYDEELSNPEDLG